MNFLKMHGLGNDFVFVDCIGDPAGAEAAQKRAAWLCDRHFGVGADGVVLVLQGTAAPLRMRIFNPDGSEAEMCGNAMRCFARYTYERGLAGDETFPVETLAGIMWPTVKAEDGQVRAVSVDMGPPHLAPQEIPMDWPHSPVLEQPLPVGDETVTVTCLSMGNPHCVIYVEDVDAYPVAQMGSKIERHPAFPKRTNVEFVQVLSSHEVRVRVWERGAGETLACGTGAAATTVASVLTGRAGREITVNLPGGALLLRWRDDDHVVMAGPAEYVFEGRTTE